MRRFAHRAAARAQLEMARRSTGFGVVLLYHATGPVAGDPRRDLVPALATSVFREQLEHLVRRYEVVPVTELRSRLSTRPTGRRVPVALTFDDDLWSHCHYAAPALSDRGLPATFYLTGRTLDGPDPFWWQDLQALADRRPRGLADVRDRLAPQGPWARDASELRDLAFTIEGLPRDQRDAVAEVLRDMATGIEPDPGLSAGAVRELVAGGFDIGFHTRRHDALDLLGDQDLGEAMHDGRDRLDTLAGRAMNSIAYPHGRADLRVARAAEQADYETGLTWKGGAVRDGRPTLLWDRVDGWTPSAGHFAWRLARVAARGADEGARNQDLPGRDK